MLSTYYLFPPYDFVYVWELFSSPLSIFVSSYYQTVLNGIYYKENTGIDIHYIEKVSENLYIP